jgi:hypothetical protein
MAVYGLFSIAWAGLDLMLRSRVEVWADVALVAFGLLLLLSAAFVRVLIPGGLALALGALLGLQALSVHEAAHTPEGLTTGPQIIRGAVAVGLLALAFFGARVEKRRPHAD